VIDPNAWSTFPDNVIALMNPAFDTLDPDIDVYNRPLRPSDPDHTIGIFPALWTPDDESYEIGHSAPHEPTLQRYQIGVQGLVKNGDEPTGLKIHSILATRIRRVLYKNASLRNAIASLVVTDSGSTERIRRWTVRLQRYMNNEVKGTFIFVSTCEVILETEIT
jgi:hypothetical protein